MKIYAQWFPSPITFFACKAWNFGHLQILRNHVYKEIEFCVFLKKYQKLRKNICASTSQHIPFACTVWNPGRSCLDLKKLCLWKKSNFSYFSYFFGKIAKIKRKNMNVHWPPTTCYLLAKFEINIFCRSWEITLTKSPTHPVS